MPIEEVTPAIVLRARDYSEADRIVSLLTRDAGKLSGIAKGAKASRRRFERKLEPFSHVMLYFRRRPHGELVFITRAEAGGLPPHNLDDDLGKIALASYMAELTDALTREEAEASGAYQLLCDAMCTLARRGAGASLRQAFELKLLQWAGFGLEFARCRVCAALPGPEDTSIAFIAARGGIVCRRCRAGLQASAIGLAAASVNSLARLGLADFATACDLSAAGSDGALAMARFIAGVIDRRLRSAEFLESIL
jgi:DNA repair protein RecO (recombination protein O)